MACIGHEISDAPACALLRKMREGQWEKDKEVGKVQGFVAPACYEFGARLQLIEAEQCSCMEY